MALKNFKQFNESIEDKSIRDLMTPKSEEDIMKYFEGLDQIELNEILMGAIRSNQTDIVKMVLNAGADPNIKNVQGNTVLFLAVVGSITVKPNEDTIKILLKNGANPNIPNNRGIDTLKYAKIWKRGDNIVNLIEKYKKKPIID